jgi:hypothetical protein
MARRAVAESLLACFGGCERLRPSTADLSRNDGLRGRNWCAARGSARTFLLSTMYEQTKRMLLTIGTRASVAQEKSRFPDDNLPGNSTARC